MNPRHRIAWIVSAIALAGAVAWVGASWPRGPIARGVRLSGEVLPSDASIAGWFDAREEALRSRTVALKHGETSIRVALAELGVAIDRDETEARVRAVAHVGAPWRRLREAREARQGRVDVPYAYAVDRDVMRVRIEAIAKTIDREAVPARLDLTRREQVAAVEGTRVDVAATVERLLERVDVVATGAEPSIDLVVDETRPEDALAGLEGTDLTKLLASFETRYAVHKRSRAHNVELAASRIDGVILAPGATMSFNERVGPRTKEAGFEEAPEIVRDELTNGFGGGTCQVSSTLHGAALHGALEIVERRNHSRLSDYITLGLDAAVKYPVVDLRIRNPHPFGVVVHAFSPRPGILRVELLGGDVVERVGYSVWVAKTEPFLRRITEKGYLPTGSSTQRQKGTRGMDVHSYVTIRFRDGRVEQRRVRSVYRPTPEVFWVGPGFDRQTLPPLPEHAKGVEGEAESANDDPVVSG